MTDRRCDKCDPSFGCWSESARCSKRDPRLTSDELAWLWRNIDMNTARPLVVRALAELQARRAADLSSGGEADGLEAAYWRFDSLRAGTNAERVASGLGPQAERDAFKAAVRAFVRLHPPPDLSDADREALRQIKRAVTVGDPYSHGLVSGRCLALLDRLGGKP